MTSRLNYIDALRGLAIFAVVYGHLEGFSIHLSYHTNINLLFSAFFIPLFFFISGYVGYRTSLAGGLWPYVVGKCRTLLVPSVAAYLAAAWFFGFDPWLGIQVGADKAGYWFAYVLFQMCLVYGFAKWLLGHVQRQWLYLVLFAALSAAVLWTARGLVDTEAGTVLSCGFFYVHFPFFLLGALARRYSDGFHRLLSVPWVLLSLFVLAFVGQVVPQVPKQVTSLGLVGLLYALFWHRRAWFDGSGRAARLLPLLGRYSLVIYFLHFALLFRMPEAVTAYMDGLRSDFAFAGPSGASFVEFLLLAPLAVLTSLTCIGIKRLLNLLPVVPELFFGNRR